jgi:glycosyltransferase involved in cell wall biosynthesis
MRTVLFVTNSEAYGGTEQHLIELVKRLDRSRVHPIILEIGDEIYRDVLRSNAVECEVVRTENFKGSASEWFTVFRRARPDSVVFINNWYRCFPWFASLAACLAGVPRRFSIHHLQAPEMQKVRGWWPGSILRRVAGGRVRRLLGFKVSTGFLTKVICVSNSVRGRLVDEYRFPSEKTITIHNGVSAEAFTASETGRAAKRASLGLNPDWFLLVCVARLIEQKGIDILLKAIERVLRQGIECRCIVIGDGPLKDELAKQAQGLRLFGAVTFAGHQKNVRPYLQSADAFVLASLNEGLPLSILEAMASGLPCIVTNVGGNAEAVVDKRTGLVIAPGSVDELADGIAYLATHPKDREMMSKNARERACNDFDIDACMDKIKAVILN